MIRTVTVALSALQAPRPPSTLLVWTSSDRVIPGRSFPLLVEVRADVGRRVEERPLSSSDQGENLCVVGSHDAEVARSRVAIVVRRRRSATAIRPASTPPRG